MDCQILISGGGSPESIEIQVDSALPQASDVAFALTRQKSRILERTSQGVDADSSPFAGYNTTRPYYWYPNGRVGRRRAGARLKTDQRAVKRAARNTGARGVWVTRSGLGVRYPSYDYFKRVGLGRSEVDLTGTRAPHMLQAMAMTVSGSAGSIEGRLGIYGAEGERAAGLSSDDRPRGMPKREFLAASESDQKAMAGDIMDRVVGRMKGR